MTQIATYNIHRCIGGDGHYDPGRIRKVLQEIDADVVALQEVELFHEHPGLLDELTRGSEWRAIHDVTLRRSSGHYGNAVLTRLPVLAMERVDLSWPGREPRGALVLRLDSGHGVIGFVATHLGLRPAERREQVRRLLATMERLDADGDEGCPLVLAGDLNEWLLWGRPLRWLRRRFLPTPSPATWPASRPVFALDRIWVSPRSRLVSIDVHDSPLARRASDHRPLVARLET
ncbi:endonuclease [Marinihelvus fidelis]|uniref:Endonuclease n=1 Tax=Marinihelvus fidelis TaxID=2613842 RepID=A0A5N0T6G4_9GAMM|nr:endonuclease/exonuclease/phosphatase family protein [Marinihelvus fidelis]KAA9130553.1 endonuclease [Marinihelvus fidelis]